MLMKIIEFQIKINQSIFNSVVNETNLSEEYLANITLIIEGKIKEIFKNAFKRQHEKAKITKREINDTDSNIKVRVS